MSIRASLLARVERVAVALGADLDQVVLLGGAALALYDSATVIEPRPTDDVDLLVDLDRVRWHALLGRLRTRGLREDMTPGAPICRMLLSDAVPPIPVDVMPIDPLVLGFSNRWSGAAFRSAVPLSLSGGAAIAVATPLHFVATKLDAFRSRGGDDWLASHDLEDAIAILATDAQVRSAIESRLGNVGAWLGEELRSARETLLDVVPGHLPGNEHGQALAVDLLRWLDAL